MTPACAAVGVECSAKRFSKCVISRLDPVLACKEKQPQMMIETPYRNAVMLEALATNCQAHTLICIATDLSLPSESIQTKTANEWKKLLQASTAPDFHKKNYRIFISLLVFRRLFSLMNKSLPQRRDAEGFCPFYRNGIAAFFIETLHLYGQPNTLQLSISH